jgi:hypothetical protein
MHLFSGPLKVLTDPEPTAVSPQAETATERLEPPLDGTRIFFVAGLENVCGWREYAHPGGTTESYETQVLTDSLAPERLVRPWMPLFS